MKDNELKRILCGSDILYYGPRSNCEVCDYGYELSNIFMDSYKKGYYQMIDNYIIDVKRLTDKINLDCFNCYKINPNGCCNGSCGKFDGTQYRMVIDNLYNIIKGRFSNKEISEMIQYGVFETSFDEEGNEIYGDVLTYLDENENYKCPFLMTTEKGSKICSIKNWCYAEGVDITDVCSFNCLLFPLEIFLLKYKEKEYVMITSIIDRTIEPYCRWGVDKSVTYMCFDGCNRDLVKNKLIFKRNKYVPVYNEFSELFVKWFGKKIYKKIKDICEGNSND